MDDNEEVDEEGISDAFRSIIGMQAMDSLNSTKELVDQHNQMHLDALRLRNTFYGTTVLPVVVTIIVLLGCITTAAVVTTWRYIFRG